ncbi:hypothetical protein [Oceanicella actignis]|uniref:Uncharacterized protein n=1 Tax=Oceanicella actignis TaxID=1189325 RepID=A0A1M7U212_9RHOB|nr:hypothetical protein [Oceanicella actignis]SES76123.1 hypothetical protein SAMN04488119_101383 [Oceanicella actignis]SHN77045.1 hypothetical protein SAMN05216200_11439 [Oceanicella actignis]
MRRPRPLRVTEAAAVTWAAAALGPLALTPAAAPAMALALAIGAAWADFLED